MTNDTRAARTHPDTHTHLHTEPDEQTKPLVPGLAVDELAEHRIVGLAELRTNGALQGKGGNNDITTTPHGLVDDLIKFLDRRL